MSEQTELIPSAPVDLMHLVGLWVQARSPRREYSGVILPRGSSSRAWRLRLALDDGRILPLDSSWEIRPHDRLLRDTRGKIRAIATAFNGKPIYRWGDLPSRQLATRTMLSREHRARPAPGQPVLAYYLAGQEYADLFAIADTVNLPPLSPKRQAAWDASRTCAACGKRFGSPLQRSPEPERARRCAPCHQLAAEQQWIQAVRPVQAEMSAWAREVLADPTVVIAAWDGGGVSTYHVEDLTGRKLLHARIRPFDDPATAAKCPQYADTVSAREILPQIQALDGRRIITWHRFWPGDLHVYDGQGVLMTPVLRSRDTDELADRYRLWTGESPLHRMAYWYPAPRLPWNYTGSLDRAYRKAVSTTAQVAVMREFLHAMAEDQPPQPTIQRQGTR
jgi:hypothetical protein